MQAAAEETDRRLIRVHGLEHTARRSLAETGAQRQKGNGIDARCRAGGSPL
jgi:hypothetical protein